MVISLVFTLMIWHVFLATKERLSTVVTGVIMLSAVAVLGIMIIAP